jgi:epoxyqueuosine reductase
MKHFVATIEAKLGRPVETRRLSDTARIVDRAVAARSGLGWYGKHSCLIVPGHGSWVMLGEVLIDVEVEVTPPIAKNCGRCSICIDRCPTGAIVEPYRVDTPTCLSYQTIEQRGAIPVDLRPRLGDWVFGCDICQDVCPYTGAAAVVQDLDFAPKTIDHAYPSLTWLLAVGEEAFRAAFQGSAVLRAKRRGMARNAAVALANSRHSLAPHHLSLAMLDHEEPLVRGHAAWGLGELGGGDSRRVLDQGLRRESDPDVRSEMIHALASL